MGEKITLREFLRGANDGMLYPYPLSRQKTGVSKVDSSPCVKAGGTEGARRATAVPVATAYDTLAAT